MDGLLVVDKPAGPTSHDVVARVRRALRQARVGHTGTLDPAATGVLCLVLGRATRLAQFLTTSDKAYEAVVRFGFATDTGDAEGRAADAPRGGALPRRDAIEAALEEFRGTFLQQPPAFSAKKIAGKRSHRLARARARAADYRSSLPPDDGLAVIPAPVSVTVYQVDIAGIDADCVKLLIRCSAGFYVRSLAHDLGERLGVGAHLANLRRTRAGQFGLESAIALDALEGDPEQARAAVIPLAEMLPELPAFRLSSDGVRRAKNGCALGQSDRATGTDPESDSQPAIPSPSQNPQTEIRSEQSLVRLVDAAGSLVGIARAAAGSGLLHPAVVLM
jgi:tRNA pseudouridine55 synthase